jgi:ATP-dependent RNA helicase DeaD
LFVAPRERKLLANIEHATRQKVVEMGLPSTELINNKRIARFKQSITDTLAAEELGFFKQLMEQYQQEHDVSALEIAAALAKLLEGDTPLLLKNPPKAAIAERPHKDRDFDAHERKSSDKKSGDKKFSDKPARSPRRGGADIEMELFRIEVGHVHGVKPGNIVGAIANETGIDGDHIARIKIEENYSTVELPAGMPKNLLEELKKVRVAGQQLRISKMSGTALSDDSTERKKDKSKKRMSSTSIRRSES